MEKFFLLRKKSINFYEFLLFDEFILLFIERVNWGLITQKIYIMYRNFITIDIITMTSISIMFFDFDYVEKLCTSVIQIE